MFGSKESDSTNPENKKPPVLDFDGKKYDINSLPDEVKENLKGLQVADTQIRMYKDTLRLLERSRDEFWRSDVVQATFRFSVCYSYKM